MSKLNIFSITILLVTLAACSKRELPSEGVSLELAQLRKANIDSVSYKIHFNIPDIKSNPIRGSSTIGFVATKSNDVILDFRAESNMVENLTINGLTIEFIFANGHIVIPKRHVKKGKNSLQIDFIAGTSSLNRNDEYLYTLLVPDRASTVFPCFDQPDMKASFELSLTISTDWKAVSNGRRIDEINNGNGSKNITFEVTKPISTYLFAFAAGKFETISKKIGSYEFTLYHRETDTVKLKRNTDIVFDYHAQSIRWLEDYTQILYPFGKLDFVLIPGFQYSGMEHPGAIFYRDSRLLLDENATLNQKLRQANLIAHEVAHQWFGNLVTMRWFNDVWLKEVFAGLIADKIVNPMFPDLNHNLSFLLSHYPRAYSVDRTEGANPIVQNLDNLLNAGTLYGDIIYHKAPIMFRQLELFMGEEPFKQGVREYLKKYKMANANWDELVEILNGETTIDLIAWSESWTKSTGRPVIQINSTIIANGNKIEISSETDETLSILPMQFSISYLVKGNEWTKTVFIDSLPYVFNYSVSDSLPIIYPNSNGFGYGCISADSVTVNHTIRSKTIPTNSLTRASFIVSLHELFLEGKIDREKYYRYLTHCFVSESDAQIQSFILNSIELVFRKFSDQQFFDTYLQPTEQILWNALNSHIPTSQKRSILTTLTSIFQSPQMVSLLYQTWVTSKVGQFTLSEDERTALAVELMVRKPELYNAIYQGEYGRIANSDRQKRFALIAKAASALASERIAFFDSLANPANRKPEPWIAEGLRILHHPLRSEFSIRFIEPSLNMLSEIQRTGDIFFPKDWLDATLYGHNSAEAYQIVDYWLRSNETISSNLKLKVLQSVDMLKRSAQ